MPYRFTAAMNISEEMSVGLAIQVARIGFVRRCPREYTSRNPPLIWSSRLSQYEFIIALIDMNRTRKLMLEYLFCLGPGRCQHVFEHNCCDEHKPNFRFLNLLAVTHIELKYNKQQGGFKDNPEDCLRFGAICRSRALAKTFEWVSNGNVCVVAFG